MITDRVSSPAIRAVLLGLLTLLAVMLTACGQKGPLQRPEPVATPLTESGHHESISLPERRINS
ncbi:MAG TPA: lipoprotein [Pseudohongiella sp.]|nr:lipoprotein [Pseudohongiella sp.]